MLRRALLGLGVATVLLLAVPAALLHLGGAPTPSKVGEQLALGAPAWAWLAAWLGWLLAIAASVRDLLRALSADPLVRARAGLVGGALAALLTFATPSGASTSTARSTTSNEATAGVGITQPAPHRAHIVATGECLWTIAEDELGDGAAWTTIWALNAGASMGQGARFDDPSLVLPGWQLRLPDALDRTPAPVPGTASTTHPAPRDTGGTVGVVLPEAASPDSRWLPGALTGGSVLALALLGSWLHRRRRSLGEEAAAAWAALDDPLLDELEAVDAIRAAPMLDRVGSAWAAVRSLGLEDEVRAIAVGNAGCRALTTVHGGSLLDLPSVEAGEELPALLCLGDDANSSWVAPLLPGRTVVFDGPGARQVLRAATAQLAWWPWTEDLVVTSDASLAERELALRGRGSVVFTGRPEQLTAALKRELAIVTTGTVREAADVLHCELDDDGLVVAGLRLGRPDPSPELIAHAVDLDAVGTSQLTEVSATPLGAHAGPSICLLTPRPRVEGLVEDLAAERERKATELIAYLAMHRGGEVPADRLRARLLGRRDGDGSAKTLANIASVARRAIGAEHFPLAGSSSTYRVHGVTTDLELMDALVAEGEASLDGTARVALLREALRLIEGEPMAAVTSGYAWWRSEGHAARASALASSAAWSLVDDAVGEGSIALAAWGIGQARLLDPESESLLRAEMVLAGIADDPDALREAWNRCVALHEGLPSAAAERTYETVASRLQARRP